MASSEDYARWIVANADKKGTPDFEVVAKAYADARSKEISLPAEPNNPASGYKNTLQIYNPIGKNFDTGVNIGDTTANVLAGAGRGLTNIARGVGQHLGLINQKDIQEANKLDAPLLDTSAGSVGNFIGTSAAFLPTALIPGANTYAGAAAIGAGAGALEPVSNGGILSGSAKNAALGLGAGLVGQGLGNAVGTVAKGLGSMVRPYTRKGQDLLAGKALLRSSESANDPKALLDAINKSPKSILEGSPITTSMAAGDVNLAGLNRTLSLNPEYNAELTRLYAQRNAAQNNAIADIAGNPGKLAVAKEARDEIALPMMNEVLDRAGLINSAPILKKIGRKLSNPDNAGRFSQDALTNAANQISKFTNDQGMIHARSLYALRKDINDILGGKLQGEAGNLKHASSQLIDVKNMIDDAIEAASKPPESGKSLAIIPQTGTEIAPLETAAREPLANQPIPTWKEYLKTYSELSKPIEQMKVASKVYKQIQNGTRDTGGNLTLSGSKLNKLLIQDGTNNLSKKIGDTLSPEQIQVLRNLSTDLDAGNLGLNAGRAVGSNTVQNLASNQLLGGLLGENIHPALTPLKKFAGLAYSGSDAQILKKLEDASLNPEEASRLLQIVISNSKAKNNLSKLNNVQRQAITNGLISALASQQPVQQEGTP